MKGVICLLFGLSWLGNLGSSIFSGSGGGFRGGSGGGGGGIGSGIGSVTVEFEQFLGFNLGGFENLHLSDKDVLEGIDLSAFLLDGQSNGVGNKFADEVFQFARGFVGDDFGHFLSNEFGLFSLSIRSLSQLIGSTSSESNDENSENESIKSFDFNVGLNETLPFSNQRSIFISS